MSAVPAPCGLAHCALHVSLFPITLFHTLPPHFALPSPAPISHALLAQLCDFNYSQELAQGKQLVKSQRYANSPKWQSPEVLKGGCYSHATDTFSLGVILWEIVTLEQPWKFTCAPSLPQRGVVAAMALHDTRVSEEVRGVIGCPGGRDRMQQANAGG